MASKLRADERGRTNRLLLDALQRQLRALTSLLPQSPVHDSIYLQQMLSLEILARVVS